MSQPRTGPPSGPAVAVAVRIAWFLGTVAFCAVGTVTFWGPLMGDPIDGDLVRVAAGGGVGVALAFEFLHQRNRRRERRGHVGD